MSAAKVVQGMFLLQEDLPPAGIDRPVRYEIWCVKSVRKLKNGDASCHLLWGNERLTVEATAKFPRGEIADPWRVFDLNQSDRRLVWNRLAEDVAA
jgi:hypothetical protein